MANVQESQQPSSTRRHWLDSLAASRDQFVIGLFVTGFLLLLIPLTLWIRYKRDFLLVTLATILPALTTLVCAFVDRIRPPGRLTATESVRLLVLMVGGLLGLDLVVISGALAYQWWDVVAGGLEAWQGEERQRLWVVLFLLLGGLGLMFVSVQLARSEERSSPLLRRILYGYNAVLNGLLVLAILAILNFLGYMFLPASDDWTTRSIFTLSSRSESILEGLDRPTRIYVISAGEDDLMTIRNLKALLENCQAVNKKMRVDYLSPDLNQEQVAQLARQFNFTEREGILIVYGSEPNTESQFIRMDALYSSSNPFGQQQQERRFFKGESELMTALSFLAEGKQKPVIYFTQGNGELDINDVRSRQVDRGAGFLRQRLEQDNLTVKGLELSNVEGRKSRQANVVVSTTVPKDATIVVLAGPKQRLPDYALKALRDYMNPSATDKDRTPGKLIVLADVVLAEGGGKMEPLGLKEFLAEFSVELGDNRLMQVGLARYDVLQVAVAPLPQSQNPIAAKFEERPLLLYDVRTVQPLAGNRPDGGRYQAETLLAVLPQINAWADTSFKPNPRQYVTELLRDRQQELRQKLTGEPLSVAVTVTEQAARANPHMMPPPGEAKPRLVVVGDASLACNWSIHEADKTSLSYDLFQSMLAWLRERPSNIGIEAKKQDVYTVEESAVNNRSRMVLIPAALLFVGIIGLGAGVWVVRRR